MAVEDVTARRSLFDLERRLEARGGRRGLGVYVIPGYPTWETSERALEIAARRGVDFIEYPIILGDGWSSATGPTLVEALTGLGRRHADAAGRLARWIDDAPCPIGVVYRSAWPKLAECLIPAALEESTVGLLLEAQVVDWDAYAEHGAARGMPVVWSTAGFANGLSIADRRRLAAATGFVYMSLGRQTGQMTASLENAGDQIALIRAERPRLPVMCAFGIESAAGATEVCRRTGCDGVIIGTAAVENLRVGLARFDSWLAEIEEALRG